MNIGDTAYGSPRPVRNCALGGDDHNRVAALTADPYASPSVSNIAALMASAAVLPAQTTNWNAG